MSTTPRPRDGATVLAVAVDGVPLTWIGPPLGEEGPSEIAGDGTPTSHALIKKARELWADPIKVDHPSWKHEVFTTNETPLNVLATFLHLGHGRGVILEAPEAVVEDLFSEPEDADIEVPREGRARYPHE